MRRRCSGPEKKRRRAAKARWPQPARQAPYCNATQNAGGLNPAHQNQNEQDDDDKAEPAAAVIAGAVERTAADAAEPAQQGDDQNDENDCADAHLGSPPTMERQPRWNPQVPSLEDIIPPARSGRTASYRVGVAGTATANGSNGSNGHEINCTPI